MDPWGKLFLSRDYPASFVRERVCTKILAKLREKAKWNDGKLGKLKKEDTRKENEKEQRCCSGYSATSLRAFLADVFARLDCQDDGIAKHTLPSRSGTESSGTSVPATELTQHKYSFVREG